MTHHDAPSAQDPHAHEHPASMLMLVSVFSALLVLTVITVAAAYVDMGEFNLIVAMGIASVKATLVALFFMHLLHDNGFNRLAFFMSFVFVGLFVTITMMDTGQYQADLQWDEHVLPMTPAAP